MWPVLIIQVFDEIGSGWKMDGGSVLEELGIVYVVDSPCLYHCTVCIQLSKLTWRRVVCPTSTSTWFKMR
jgi:hypothetical protein